MQTESTKADFSKCLAQDTISATDLDDLSDFCPCAIHSGRRNGAQQSFIKLLLEDRSVAVASPGRRHFACLWSFSKSAPARPSADPVKDFLGSCYAEAIGSERWVVPEALAPARSKWALYARNEMMSLAWYTFFKLALDELDGQPKPFHDVRHFADWLLSRPSFAFPARRRLR